MRFCSANIYIFIILYKYIFKIMKNTIVEINDRKYRVKVAETEEEQEKGLQDIDNLDDDEGMLFAFEEPISCYFHMKGTKINLDIILINKDDRVFNIYNGKADDDTPLVCEDVKYVLELNPNNNIKIGDIVEIEDYDNEEEDDDEEEEKLYVIGENGRIQAEVESESRIFSRIHTKNLIKLSKRAKRTKNREDYIKLGKKISHYIDIQDTQKQEYTKIKD